MSRWRRNPRASRQRSREQLKRDLNRRIDWLEEELQHLDVESRLRMRTILQLYKDLYGDVDDPDLQDYTISTFRTSVAQIGSLTERALRLARKKRDLQRYLDRNDETQLLNYLQDLQARTESTTDPVIQSQYEQAMSLKKRELEDYRAIATTVRRIDGQLENVECAFAGLRARVVRLKAADVTQWDVASEQLKGELESLSSVVEMLEQSVNEALSI